MTPALAKLLALAEKSAPTPWRVLRTTLEEDPSSDDPCACREVPAEEGDEVVCVVIANDAGEIACFADTIGHEAEFVVAARNELPKIAEDLAASERERDEALCFALEADDRRTAAVAALVVAREALETITQVTPEHLVGAAFVAREALATLPPRRSP